MNTPNQDRLDPGLIREAMVPEAQVELRQLTLLQETDSTNTAVLRLPGDRQHAHAVLAECQRAGGAGGKDPGILPREAIFTSAWVGGSGTASGRFPRSP